MKLSLQVGHSTNSNIRTPLQFSKTPNGRVKDVQNRHFGLQIKRSLLGYFQHGFGLGYYLVNKPLQAAGMSADNVRG